MKRINLIPDEAKHVTASKWLKLHLFRSRTGQLVTFAAIVFVLMNLWQVTAIMRYKLVAAGYESNIKSAEVSLTRAKNASARLKSENDDIARQAKAIEEKLKVLEGIRGERLPWSKFLVGMSKVTPDDLWINKVAMDKDVVTVKGTTLNNEIVSRFMAALDESKYFGNTSFNYTEKAKQAEEPVIDFEVTTHVNKI